MSQVGFMVQGALMVWRWIPTSRCSHWDSGIFIPSSTSTIVNLLFCFCWLMSLRRDLGSDWLHGSLENVLSISSWCYDGLSVRSPLAPLFAVWLGLPTCFGFGAMNAPVFNTTSSPSFAVFRYLCCPPRPRSQRRHPLLGGRLLVPIVSEVYIPLGREKTPEGITPPVALSVHLKFGIRGSYTPTHSPYFLTREGLANWEEANFQTPNPSWHVPVPVHPRDPELRNLKMPGPSLPVS